METNAGQDYRKNHLLKYSHGVLRRIYTFMKKIRLPFRIVFILMGMASTIWFLVRVIPKPSRATYPCMRATAPIMSSFIVYLITLFTATATFKLAGKKLRKSQYLAGAAMILAAVVSSVLLLGSNPARVKADVEIPVVVHEANQPMGEGVGVFPGRVVWAWDPDATDETCTNSGDDAYFYPNNNNQEVIDRMLSDALHELTGTDNDKDAWSALFKNFNGRKWDEPEWDYATHEDIVIKTNATSTWGYPGGTYITADFSVRNTSNYIAETNPHVVLAVLRQLVNVVGVLEQNIWVGDPMKHIYKHAYDLWSSEFPDINYIGSAGGAGRTQVVEGEEPVIFYSDEGSVMPGAVSDKLYTVMENADYMINIPNLKAHARAGITISAKNHFGSHTRGSASHLHDGLVAPNEGPAVRTELGMYRVQVDLMGHELIGKNTMLVLVDGLYAGPEATWPPDKWNMEPFNGDWTSSLLASMDQVAIESVCFDFLRTEYDNKTVKNSRGSSVTCNFPNMAQGVDDYLEQAADPSKWPAGIIYDPEDDGEPLTSLGAHEHWDDPETKQYSRNLGLNEGIELIGIPSSLVGPDVTTATALPEPGSQIKAYPNPFTDQVSLKLNLIEQGKVKIDIYNIKSQLVSTISNKEYNPGEHIIKWDGISNSGMLLPAGIYIVKMEISTGSGILVDSKQLQIIR